MHKCFSRIAIPYTNIDVPHIRPCPFCPVKTVYVAFQCTQLCIIYEFFPILEMSVQTCRRTSKLRCNPADRNCFTSFLLYNFMCFFNIILSGKSFEVSALIFFLSHFFLSSLLYSCKSSLTDSRNNIIHNR